MAQTSKKVVLITGCSAGGIGDELARQLHNRGLRVIATARNASSMESLAALEIETLLLDITDLDSIVAAKKEVSKMTDGKLDVLINNAGASYPYAATDLSLDKVKALFHVNLFGHMMVVKEFIPLLLASEDARILNMGSLAGVMPIPFGSAYNASKAALHSYGDSLRVELAPFNIKVITVVAGNVRSNLSKPWHKLPPDSIYQPIRDIYQTRRIDNFQEGATPREQIAQSIVAEIFKQKPRAWLWGGKNAWVCWLINTFLGRRGFDLLLSKRFGLSQLAALRLREKKSL